MHAVTIQSGFWARRREINVTKSIPTHARSARSERPHEQFPPAGGQERRRSSTVRCFPTPTSTSGPKPWDLCCSRAIVRSCGRARRKLIDEVVAVQEPSGYLNTYYVDDRKSLRMLPQTQTTGHELYNIGHMLQGAIAYYRATGDRKLLDAGIRFVDDFLIPNYGPAPKKPIVSGHPEIEMGLIELYRITGDKRQLDLAGYILQGDKRIDLPERRTIYMFSGTPFTARTKLEGHAVRAMYACCGATDYYMETGDDSYWKTLNTLWNDMTTTKMYVTGGVGSRVGRRSIRRCLRTAEFPRVWGKLRRHRQHDVELAHAGRTGDAKFTDVIERALYNGINSGMSLDGAMYCYRNPLAFDPSTGEKIRNPWYDITCCPPNLERTFGSLPGYFYSTSNDGIYVHLYDNSELDWHLGGWHRAEGHSEDELSVGRERRDRQ